MTTVDDNLPADDIQGVLAHVTAIRDHARAIVDAAPPLTGEQRTRLAVLLAPPAQQRRAS